MGRISLDDDVNRAVGDASTQMTMHPLAEELLEIAARICDVAAAAAPTALALETPPGWVQKSRNNHLDLARKTYALRRKRAAIFGKPELFGEPAWDILLDLYIAQAEGKPVSVSSACIGSASPATTGLRWLGILADEGLVVRENDCDDHRRVLVRLTAAGMAAMERFFETFEATV